MNIYRTRLTQLRALMKANDLDLYIIVNTDPHLGEYIPAHWKNIQWLTGFTGSSAIVVVGKKFAGLWTDSRYFLQAEQQLEDTGFSMMKMNVPSEPSWVDWISDKIKKNNRVGADGRLLSVQNLEKLRSVTERINAEIDLSKDLLSEIWTGRPPLSDSIAFDHSVIFSGKERKEKISDVRSRMEEMNVDYHLITSLDDIMWLLNIRGNDIEFSPLLLSYIIIGKEQVLLFTDEKKIPLKLAREFDRQSVTILPYSDVPSILSRMKRGVNLLITAETTNATLFSSIPSDVNIIRDLSIPGRLKSVKNEVEIANLKTVMAKDGVALVKFFIWLEKAIKDHNVTEQSVSEKILEFRLQQANCTGASFQSIIAFREHGAIVHYNPSYGRATKINNNGVLLIDSGGQYLDGTTDITRTVYMGTPGEGEKKDYTLVLKGLICLASAKFPLGTRGYQLDALARHHIWNSGANYGHGTGHGVGFYLNVHEGPQNIGPGMSEGNKVPLQPGMLISDEPGIYREGKYGIRLENILLVENGSTTEFGHFLRFETLTLCHFEKDLIDRSLLENFEIAWLNSYHSRIYTSLEPLLNEDEKRWLKSKTEEI
jgi:Xaa-Pro aminopeptidase